MRCLKIKCALAHIYPSVVSGPLFASKANQLAQLQPRSSPQPPTRKAQISTVSTQAHTSIQLWFLNIIQVGCLVRGARLHLSVCDVCLEVLIFCYPPPPKKKKEEEEGERDQICAHCCSEQRGGEHWGVTQRDHRTMDTRERVTDSLKEEEKKKEG